MAEIATENKAPSSGKKLKVWLIVLAAVLIVGGVVLFLKIKSDRDEALRQSIIGSGTFHPGITVAGVDVSGMTPDEAAEALKGAEQSLVQDVSFRITDGEHIYAFDQPHFDIAFDTEAILAEAMALGREGDLDSLQAELADIAENGRSFDLSYTAVPRDAESFVAEMAAELDTPATDATFSVKQLELNEDTEALDVVNIGFTEEELAAVRICVINVLISLKAQKAAPWIRERLWQLSGNVPKHGNTAKSLSSFSRSIPPLPSPRSSSPSCCVQAHGPATQRATTAVQPAFTT